MKSDPVLGEFDRSLQVDVSFASIFLLLASALPGVFLLLGRRTQKTAHFQKIDKDEELLYEAQGFGRYKYCGLRPNPFAAEPLPLYSLTQLDLPLPRMEPNETAALHQLEQCVMDVHHEGYQRSDRATLLRFLRARQGDVQLAATLFREAAAWRQTQDVNRALTHWNLDALEQCLAPWWPSGGFLGFGLNGEPLAFERIGRCDFPRLTDTLPFEILLKIDLVQCMRSLGALEEDAMRRQVPLGQVILVIDADGFGFEHAQIGAARKLAKLVESRTFMMTETVSQLLVIRAPVAFVTAWGIFKGLLDPGVAKKVRMATPACSLSLLRQFIDDDNIPAYLGGKKTTHGDPECRHILAPGGFPPEAALDRLKKLIEEEGVGSPVSIKPGLAPPLHETASATHPGALSPYTVSANEVLLPNGRGHSKAMVLKKRRNCWGCW